MRLHEITALLNEELRPGIAEQWDNVGLLAGDPNATIKNIGCALDADETVLRQCVRKKINLLVTHHPLFLKPLDRVVAGNRVADCIRLLVKYDISLYCAHTNLDLLRWGTARALCDALRLEYKAPLVPYARAGDRKLVTFVPAQAMEKVRNALAAAGAGIIGNYACCSFALVGTGSFRGLAGSHPVVGKAGSLETCKEQRLEMAVAADRVAAAVHALKAAHPYEEPAYDLVPLDNNNEQLGWGACAALPRPVQAGSWVRFVKKALNIPAVKVHQWDSRRKIKTVALMPGSGGKFMHAIPSNADAFITGDLAFHDLQNMRTRAIIMDAGHGATESPVVPVLARRVASRTGMRCTVLSNPGNQQHVI